MIQPCSVNVTDLAIYRRTQSGRGGDGTAVAIASGLRAHHERAESATRTTGGRDATISDTLLIDGVDANGDTIDVRAHDFVQWTDRLRGIATDKLSIQKVSPFTQPGLGSTLAHVQLDIG